MAPTLDRDATERKEVLDVEVYEDAERKVECIQFRHDHFGLRLTNKKTCEVTKMGLSQEAAEAIAGGFRKILDRPLTDHLGEVKFIMDTKPEYHWAVVKDVECP